MWKNVNGSLIHTTDTSRVRFRTNISAKLVQELKQMASGYDTHVNYLLENGLENLLAEGTITYDKKTRPKDRMQYKTTYNKELLADVKEFAAEHELGTNDVMEKSIQYIDFDDVKNKQYRYRIE